MFPKATDIIAASVFALIASCIFGFVIAAIIQPWVGLKTGWIVSFLVLLCISELPIIGIWVRDRFF